MYEKVKIDGYRYEIRKLKPAHFLADEIGVPISIFQIKKDKNRSDLLNEQINKDKPKEITKKELEDNLKLMQNLCSKAMKNFDEIKFFEAGMEHCIRVYNFIIKNSFEFFSDLTPLKESHLAHYDFMAQRYGCEPFDIVTGSLDRYMFNIICCNAGITRENIQNKKLNKKGRKYG